MESTPTLSNKNRQRLWRSLKDRIARYCVGVGGISVIIAIVLIFFYLLWVVLPLFEDPALTAKTDYPVASLNPAPAAKSLYLAVDETGTLGVRYTSAGNVEFFSVSSGEPHALLELPLGSGTITSFSPINPADNSFAVGTSDGRVLIGRHDFEATFANGERTLQPVLKYPVSNTPLVLDEAGQAITAVAARFDDNSVVIAGVLADGDVKIARFGLQENFLTGQTTLAREAQWTLVEHLGNEPPTHVMIDPFQKWLYVAGDSGNLLFFHLTASGPQLIERVDLTHGEEQLTALRFLIGGTSLLAGTSAGSIGQWFPVRQSPNHFSLTNVRTFDAAASAILDIAPEHRRKGFIATTAGGQIGIYHTTSNQVLLTRQISGEPVGRVAISARGNTVLTQSGDTIHLWAVDNDHPEISWSALWGQVWYESYSEPRYIWQSSAATSDFEPKFSLMPLVFGTLKAAFYAMLFAVPLAVMGAIYTAYFMAPALRRMVKPTIEIMAGLPTVIIGFLGGLWLAPLIEKHLTGILLIIMALPLAMLAFGYLWHKLPQALRRSIPPGWHMVVLIPVIVLVVWGMYTLGTPIEAALFGGNLPQWLSNQAGIPFDQRNSLVIGIAMGFAVIPIIFTIAEDAVFEVPKHLSYGSLALGATPWQSMMRVVLPTASPGIFSALMIGLGRAVGETMIVLMATGNTPVMTMNIFEGLRTLSANIAVEMPEAEVGSSHYRILFLTALVLFAFTFILNTIAEIVRQRLRNKYSNL